jgi:hydrogenase maturation protease
MKPKPMALVCGVGRRERGDDAVGPLVADRVALRAPVGVEVRVVEDDILGLVDAWTGRERVVLVDAMVAGTEPGTVRRFDATAQALPTVLRAVSSHAFDVGAAVELARVLGRLPASLVVYGIEGERFEGGSALSTRVEQALDGVVERVLAELHGREATS